MASPSLSSVVSNLVRASMGNSVSGTVTDEELDRHVAELIVREAKKKAERYGQTGIRAYISSNLDSNAPRPNKRFLSSIIKSTDDHNKTVLKAQALAAQEIKRERDEQERKQRRARAEEAAEAERLRRSGGSRHGSGSGSKRRRTTHREDESDGWDRWDGRTAERKKVLRDWEVWDGRDEDDEDDDRSKRKSSRSRSVSRHREGASGSSRAVRAEDEEQDHSHRRRRSRSSSPRKRDDVRERDRNSDDHSGRHKRRRTHERSHRQSHSRRSRSPSRRSVSPSSQLEDSNIRKCKRSGSPKYALDDIREDTVRGSSNGSSSPNPNLETHIQEPQRREKEKESRGRSHSHSPRPPPIKPQASSSKSKVEHDHRSVKSTPRRVVAPELNSRSPSPGPYPAVQLPSKMDRYFEESYDPRLDVAPLAAPSVPATGLIDNAEFEGWDAMLELIRIRREDKEEKKRMERLGLLPPKEKGKSKKKGVAVANSAPAVADRWTGNAVSIMDIEYKKKGSVREWDLGKEGF